jgi:predicted ATPase
MGDGLLVYFGYPQAHEEDPERAVRAGLDIVEAVRALIPREGLQLAVRIGIATGLVVVGDIVGEGASEERAVLGTTPHLAARLQATARPNTVIMADSTRQLVEGRFETERMGATVLRGISEPVEAFRVLGGERPPGLDAPAARRLTPLAGREEEIALLLKRWSQAESREGQVVLLSGEAGLGKSRIVRELLRRQRGARRSRVLYYCSPFHQNSPLYPVIEQLGRALRFERSDGPADKLAKLVAVVESLELTPAETMPYLASVLSIAGEDDVHELPPDPREVKRRSLDALVRMLLAMAAQQPVVLVVEDLHWADPTTRELLGAIIERIRRSRVLALLTFRPEFEPEWSAQAHLTWLRLNNLTDSEGRVIVRRVAGETPLPDAVVGEIVAKSDGVPLFIEELTKSILDSDLPREGVEVVAGASSLAPGSIPSTLRDALMGRLDRLGPAKEVAQLAAVLGRSFRAELLEAISPLAGRELDEALARLLETGLVFRRDLGFELSYEFKHALVQEIAYESLLKRTRQTFHRRVAEALVARRAGQADAAPEVLAHHYTEAGLSGEALEHWELAAQRAMESSAYAEAVAYQDRALERLEHLPADEAHRERALRLRVTQAGLVMIVKGFESQDARRAFEGARALCHELGDPAAAIFPVLRGLFLQHWSRSELGDAEAVAQEFLHHAEARADRAARAHAHHRLGLPLWSRGELRTAREHFEQALELHDPDLHRRSAKSFGEDLLVLATAHHGLTLCLLGYPERGLTSVRECIGHAERTESSALTLANALHWAGGYLLLLRRDYEALRSSMERLLELRARYDISGFPGSKGLLGIALVRLGHVDEGITRIREAIADYRSREIRSMMTYLLGMLAEALAAAGQPQRGIAAATEGLELAAQTGERWTEAELQRIKGELLLESRGRSADSAAEVCFLASLEVARGQAAKWWELRTATSLARLYRDQGKQREAHNLMASIYKWFTEGFDTPDLMDAKALLDELS